MNDNWETPNYLFKYLDDIFHFEIDVAATGINKKCTKYFSKVKNALELSWRDYNSCFCNPPYSRGNLSPWTRKALSESQENKNTVVCVLPLDITEWSRENVLYEAEIWIPDHRIKFINPDTGLPGKSPGKGTMIAIYSPNARKGQITAVHIPR